MQFTSNTARERKRGPLFHVLTTGAKRLPANDNFDVAAGDAMLEAALRLFAQHGLGAARAARYKAEQAFFAGDRGTYRHWLSICRLLDRRMALIAARELEAG